jgi:hypothetical protein
MENNIELEKTKQRIKNYLFEHELKLVVDRNGYLLTIPEDRKTNNLTEMSVEQVINYNLAGISEDCNYIDLKNI